MDFLDLPGIIIVLQIIAIEGILSLDNAAVLGAMANKLPDEPLPATGINRIIPARLRKSQRNAVLQVGLLGAYAGRVLMLLFAGYIITVPELKLIGGGYLALLVWNHFIEETRFEKFSLDPLFPVKFIWKLIRGTYNLAVPKKYENLPDVEVTTKPSKGFWSMVVSVELADLAFSLDNVVAAVAFTPRIELIIFGVCVGIVLMRFAARFFQKMIAIEPSLGDAAYLILAVIAIKLVLGELTGFHPPEYVQLFLSVGVLVTVVVFARARRRLDARRAGGSSAFTEADLT